MANDIAEPTTIAVSTGLVPVLPLRDVVVFPHMVIPLFVGREKSIRALDLAMEGDKRILLVAQKSAETDDPGAGDLHAIGTLAQVLQLLKLPDGTIKVLVEGVSRAQVAGVLSALSLEAAYALARYETFVIGGGQIYAAAINAMDRLIITHVDAEFPDATVYFPAIDPELWHEVSREHHEVDERNAYPFDIVVYDKL